MLASNKLVGGQVEMAFNERNFLEISERLKLRTVSSFESTVR